MNPKFLQAQEAIRNARKALRSGDRSAARRWAEQAAELTPQLEDPWLMKNYQKNMLHDLRGIFQFCKKLSDIVLGKSRSLTCS